MGPPEKKEMEKNSCCSCSWPLFFFFFFSVMPFAQRFAVMVRGGKRMIKELYYHWLGSMPTGRHRLRCHLETLILLHEKVRDLFLDLSVIN
jgi:hypothetical protein